MIVEELVSKLGLEIDGNALATLEKFRAAVSGGLASLATAAGVVGGAFVGMVAATAKAADDIGDLSEKLGVNAQALQELRVAAELSDVSFEALSTGLKFVQKNAADAAAGGVEAAKAFAGIVTQDAQGGVLAADALLENVAARFETVTNSGERTKLAMSLFGKAGADLVPLLARGREGIAAFRKEAQELGVVFGDEALQASDEYGRELVRLKFAFEGLRNTFAAPFISVFLSGAKLLVRAVQSARPLIARLSDTFSDLGDRASSVVKNLFAVGKSLAGAFGDSALGKVLANVDTFKLLGAALLGLGVVAATSAAITIGSWLAAAAPFVLLATLIGLVVDDLNAFVEGQDSLIGRLLTWIDETGNLEKVLRAALAVLTDLTNPKRWEEFARAASNAVKEVANALGFDTSSVAVTDRRQVSQNNNGVLGEGGLVDRAVTGLLGTLGVRPGGAESALAPSAQVLQTQASNFTANNNITVNASGLTAEQVEPLVSRALSDSYAKAAAAVTGGGR